MNDKQLMMDWSNFYLAVFQLRKDLCETVLEFDKLIKDLNKRNKDTTFWYESIDQIVYVSKKKFYNMQQDYNINVQLMDEVKDSKDIFVLINVLTKIIEEIEKSFATIH